MSICQIYDLCADTLWLGRYGENGARDIAIDVGRWFADLDTEGTVVLVNWRPGEDDTPYNPNVTMDGSRVVWSPSNIDLAISGRGFAELRYYVGNAIAKSKTFRTVIDRTPSEGANPPSAAEDWLERMEDAAVTAQTASETAVTAAETATEGAQAVAQALPTVTQAAATATSAATTATNAATEAAASEEVASTAANAAQSASETATAASQTAVGSASTATTKAEQAVEAAGTATTKASEATQAATTATANAQTSTAKAGEATTAAATATSKATEATTAASTASAAATTATSAASTATSAASTATAAKTAAQTAQTGAETAQAAAEQAAASVTASAEQIETNKQDITELKTDFSELSDTFDASIPHLTYTYLKGDVRSGSLQANGVVGVYPSAYALKDKIPVAQGERILITPTFLNADEWANVRIVCYPSEDSTSGTIKVVGDRVPDGGYTFTQSSGFTHVLVGLYYKHPDGSNYENILNDFSDSQALLTITNLSKYTRVASESEADAIRNRVDDFEDVFDAVIKPPEIVFIDGYNVNWQNGSLMPDAWYRYAKIDVSLFQGGNVTGVTADFPNGDAGIAFMDANDGYIVGYRNTTTGVYKWEYDLQIPENATYFYLPLRIASENDYIAPSFPWDVVFKNAQKMQVDVANTPTAVAIKDRIKELNNSRLVPTTATAPLTLMHFSDIHADSNTLNRIMADVAKYDNVSGYICTGDMVANTYGQITSWWDSSVMTCIGNHDSASYNSSTGYNWTALSMADRDVYYIAPFEENWGINHSAGTSYYYKDYTDQKVRLIVMDAMLYNGTPGAEATEQTAWLSNLLDDAITNSLHVLIAIHAPHGGATPEECTFTEYGTTQMPVWNDCNTPQTVIDIVASKITAGLHFVGYLCGHTHRDVVWDAENNGSQLMFAVTCANQTIASWKDTDLYREPGVDAYNLVTIDTTNTLVKLLRFGGADFTKNMTPRKAICFNYTTGEKVGEVL